MKHIILIAAALALTPQAMAKQEAKAQNPIFGVWETARVPEEGENNIAHIKIEACKNDPKNICGKVVWTEIQKDPETGKPPLDKNNTDENLRSRPVMCIQTLTDFEPTGELNTYDNGQLYSSRTGKTYSGHMTLKDPDHLLLTGSVMLGLFSRTTTWTRVKSPSKDPCR